MAKNAPAYDLSDGEKRDLVGLIQQNKSLFEFEERWTSGYIFENELQSFRTRQNRELELTTARHSYERAGRYTVAVKVIDIFGNDTRSWCRSTWAELSAEPLHPPRRSFSIRTITVELSSEKWC